MLKSLYKEAPMFVILSFVSLVAGIGINFSLFVEVITNDNPSVSWWVIFFDLPYCLFQTLKIAFVIAIVLNLTYYGIKRIVEFFYLKLERL